MADASIELNPPPPLALPQRRVLLLFALLITAGVLVQGQVALSPQVYFDVDPRSETARQAITSLGPSGSAVLHLVLTTLSMAALLVCRAMGMRVSRWATALVVVGGGFAVYHAMQGLDNRIHAMGWISAAAGGLAIYHLAQDAAIRRWLAAAAVGVLVYWGMDAVWFVWQEHPMTVRMFLSQEDAFLQARGWVRDSPQHELYVRRLSTPDVFGSFGLSNVFGSLLAAFSLLAAVMALLALKARSAQRLAVTAIPMLMGLTALVLTRSKGAAAGFLAGVVILAAVMLLRKMSWPQPRRRRGWVLPALGLLLIAGALAAVIGRGTIGPPDDWSGERSILFRWYYLLAGFRVWTASLDGLLLGVGPEGFRQAYLWAKFQLNPEEVTSIHSVFADYTVMLGIGGLCWSALLIGWWCGAARSVGAADEDVIDAEGEAALLPTDKSRAWVALLFALVAMLPPLLIQLAMISAETLLIWAAGVAAMLVCVAILGKSAGKAAEGVKAGLLCAGGALLVHSQIEMAFFQPASAALAWWLIALCGSCGVRPRRAERTGITAKGDFITYMGCLLLCAVLIFALVLTVVVLPVVSYEKHLATAAHRLQQNELPGTVAALSAASEAIPQARPPRRWQVGLLLDAAYARGRAGDTQAVQRLLDRAEAAAPAQLLQPPQPPEPTGGGTLGPGNWQHNPWLQRLRAEVLLARFRLLSDQDAALEARAFMQAAAEQTPYSLNNTLDLARLLDEQEQYPEAIAAYRRALAISEWNYLDPAKQLTEAQRAAIEQRVTQLLSVGLTP